jgi:hypothetical protein
MSPHSSCVRGILAAVALALPVPAVAQELQDTGVSGVDLVYATDASGGTSQLLAIAPQLSFAPVALSGPIGGQPSTWSHRRRTLGGLETEIQHVAPLVFATPFGDGVGNGGIHVLDARTNPLSDFFVAGGNPPGYEIAVCSSLGMLFTAEDDGSGGTTLRGYSYASPGSLVPLSPPAITLAGPIAAYAQRIGVDESDLTLHVPTADAIHVIQLAAGGTQMTLAHSLALAPFAPATSPSSTVIAGTRIWMVGTLDHPIGASEVVDGGWFAWTSGGTLGGATFGTVPSAPTKNWVPAAGASEMAIVGDGQKSYAYFLLREPKPGVFFVKASAIGCVVLEVGQSAITGVVPCPDAAGEPFAIPTAHGSRIAFETSFGPPFIFDPADGGERYCLLYSPLDPLGAATPFGLIGVAGALGGRISTKGLDRPLWSRDGSRLIATTSQFPGAPHPGVPGIEVLNVPSNVPVSVFQSPHTVVPNPTFPNQSIVFPSAFRPRVPAAVAFLDGLSFSGNVFHDGMASVCLTPFGEVGQKQLESTLLPLPPSAPGFRSILPEAFLDAAGGSSIPGRFGARRTTFNVIPGLGLNGVIMLAASQDEVLVQATGFNVLAAFGLQQAQPPLRIALQSGWTTSSEFRSL